MEQLNALDASFIDAEDQDRNASFAIASIAVFEGPTPSYEEFLAAIRRRLPLVPLYRRKLRKVPFGLGPPVWVDDPHFDLRYHVRQTALPAPGGDQQLRRLMARVMTQRLDRDYPLWEYWLVEGLEQGRWALISKVHHCMVDGVSGTDLYRVIFDASPEPPPLPDVEEQPVASEPSGFELAARAVVNSALLPLHEGGVIRRTLANPEVAVRQATEVLRGVMRMAEALPPAAKSSLSGPIGRQRRHTWARASLDDVKKVKNSLGGTVNDVFLAAISSGFRSLLLARGEEPTPSMIPSLVPVSLRSEGEESIYENRVSALVASLPVDVADPVERLAAIRTQMAALKASSESKAGEAVVALRRYTPFALASMFVRLAFSFPQREIVTVTTNVPGPQQPLYGLGRRLIEIIPYVPIATTLRTGISIFTYCGQVTFGITGDYATTPDIGVLAAAIEDGVAELVEAAENLSKSEPAGETEHAARSKAVQVADATAGAGSKAVQVADASPGARAPKAATAPTKAHGNSKAARSANASKSSVAAKNARVPKAAKASH
jgi:diacylglycerol O-acyltransferase / wax synthase